MKEIEDDHYKVDIEEKKQTSFRLNEENSYRSCCCGDKVTDRRLLTFISQFVFSLIIIMFCIYKLSINSDANTVSIYLPILSGIISIWIPSPSLQNK